MNLQEAMNAAHIETVVAYDPDTDGEREAAFKGASHYLVTFWRGRDQFVTQYSLGSAWTREPTGLEVMRGVLSDVSGIQYLSFEGWADSYGYDTDSRRAYRVYQSIQEQQEELIEFLADGPYDRLQEWLDTEEIMDESLDDNPPIN